MEMDPLVSVVMPTYNAELFIYKTINSVLNQTYKNFELIVVDDCSLDGTADIVKRFLGYSNKVRFLCTSENSGGPARPRNIGLKNCNGDWITFLDADDIWHPQKLEIQLLAAKKYRGNNLFCTSMLDFKNDSEITNTLYNETQMQNIEFQNLTFSMQLRKYRSPLSSLLLSNKAASSLEFNENQKLSGREDFLFVLQLQNLYGDIIKILVPLMFYRKHSEQISRKKLIMLLAQASILKNSKEHGLPKNSLFKIIYFILCHLFLSIYFRVIKGSL